MTSARAWLILIALLMRAAVPAGFMLDPASAAPALLACDGQGPLFAAPAMPAMHHGPAHRHAGHGAAAHGECPSAAGGALDQTAPPHPVFATLAQAPSAPAARRASIRSSPALGLPPSTGPPALA